AAGLSPSGIGLNHVVVDTLGMCPLSVSSRSETYPSSCIGMLSEDCSECSDSGSDLCIEESTSASLVSVIYHLLWSLTLSATSLSMASSSVIKASIRAWYRR
ncbi:hypothetical protein Tco_0275298, partial [Tanacetum coccineum]